MLSASVCVDGVRKLLNISYNTKIYGDEIQNIKLYMDVYFLINQLFLEGG